MTTFLLIATCWTGDCHSAEYWLRFWQRLFTYYYKESALLKSKCIFLSSNLHYHFLNNTVNSHWMLNYWLVFFFQNLNVSVERKLKKRKSWIKSNESLHNILNDFVIFMLFRLQIKSNLYSITWCKSCRLEQVNKELL